MLNFAAPWFMQGGSKMINMCTHEWERGRGVEMWEYLNSVPRDLNEAFIIFLVALVLKLRCCSNVKTPSPAFALHTPERHNNVNIASAGMVLETFPRNQSSLLLRYKSIQHNYWALVCPEYLACNISAFPSINFTSTSIGGGDCFFACNCSPIPGLASSQNTSMQGGIFSSFLHIYTVGPIIFSFHMWDVLQSRLFDSWVSLIKLVAWSKDLKFCGLRIQGGGGWKFWRIWAFIERVWPCPRPWVQEINLDQGAWFAPWKLTLAKARGSRGTPDESNITRSQSKKFPRCTYMRGSFCGLSLSVNAILPFGSPSLHQKPKERMKLSQKFKWQRDCRSWTKIKWNKSSEKVFVPLCELHCSERIASFFPPTKQGAAETFVHSDILANAAHKVLEKYYKSKSVLNKTTRFSLLTHSD